jgi:hypothetical protein
MNTEIIDAGHDTSGGYKVDARATSRLGGRADTRGVRAGHVQRSLTGLIGGMVPPDEATEILAEAVAPFWAVLWPHLRGASP